MMKELINDQWVDIFSFGCHTCVICVLFLVLVCFLLLSSFLSHRRIAWNGRRRKLPIRPCRYRKETARLQRFPHYILSAPFTLSPISTFSSISTLTFGTSSSATLPNYLLHTPTSSSIRQAVPCPFNYGWKFAVSAYMQAIWMRYHVWGDGNLLVRTNHTMRLL